MNLFGIAKGGISRAVVNFASGPPPSHPRTMCFHFPQKLLTHAYILKSLEEQLSHVPDVQVESLRFEDRNVILGCLGIENRWIVKCRDDFTCDILSKKGLMLCNKKVNVLYYDDVLEQEYKEYTTYTKQRNRLFADGARHDKPSDAQVAHVNKVMALQSLLASTPEGATAEEGQKNSQQEEGE